MGVRDATLFDTLFDTLVGAVLALDLTVLDRQPVQAIEDDDVGAFVPVSSQSAELGERGRAT